MPKNKGAGGKNRRKGKGDPAKPKELIYKDVGEEYGQIAKSIGNGYMDVTCFTDAGPVLRRAHIRGKMRKRVWMAAGDIVLVSTRGFEDNTCDILLKYTSDEARLLRARHQLPESVDINRSDMVTEEANIVFAEDSDDEKNTNSDNNNKKGTSKVKVAKQTRNLDMPPSDSDSE